MSQTDNQILEKCQKGDQNAFGFLYDRYIDQIYRFVFLKVGDASLAEDLTSDIFFKVFNKIHLYTIGGTASFKTRIYKVAYNTTIDYFRTKKEEINVDEIINFVSYQSDFGQDIDNKEALDKIRLFLEEQPQKVKEIFMMRFWDDLSFREISEITGESLDNCKKIVSRTLQKLPADIIVASMILFVHFF